MDTCSECRQEIRPGTTFISYGRHVERLNGGTITVEDAELLRMVHPRCDLLVTLAVGSRRGVRTRRSWKRLLIRGRR